MVFNLYWLFMVDVGVLNFDVNVWRLCLKFMIEVSVWRLGLNFVLKVHFGIDW